MRSVRKEKRFMDNPKQIYESAGDAQDYPFGGVCVGGLRTNGGANNLKPLITIITSTYNAAEQLPTTIASIRNQRFQQVEWIVIDGASSDGTVELLKKNQDVIDCWLSEPDRGIYDAWNKALPLIRGGWVLFLGAGDTLADRTSLQLFAEVLSNQPENVVVVYGKVALVDFASNKVLEVVGEPWELLAGKWNTARLALPCHQGVFHRASVYLDETYDDSYKVAADGKLLMRLLVKGGDFNYHPALVANMVQDGVSSHPANLINCFEEFARSSRECGLIVPRGHYSFAVTKIYVKSCLFWLMPRDGFSSIVRWVRRHVLRRKTLVQ